MFSRVSYQSFPCLRCQTRLADQIGTWRPPNTTPAAFSQYRRQSAVALQSKDDAHSAQSQKPDVETVRGQHGENVDNATKIDGLPTSRHRSQAPTSFKRWKPTQAEDLGVNVLGKRAEVIILPARQPKPAQAPPTDEPAAERVGLQQSLDAELVPVSMADVLKTIDSLKAQFGQGKDHFSESEWKEHSKRLADGFTKAQLQEYLQVAAGKSLSDPAATYLNVKGGQKRTLASKIMSEAWQWKHSDEEEESTSEPAHEPVKRIVRMNAAKLDYVMLHEKHQLGQISETLGVQIDVFKKKSRIQLVGIEEDIVENAVSRVNDIIKDIRRSALRMPWFLKDLLSDNAKFDALAATTMQKHQVLIKRDQDFCIVVGPAETGADVVLRDLILMSGKLRRKVQSSFGSGQSQESTTQTPAFSSDLSQWHQLDQRWFRHVSTKACFQADDVTRVAQTRDFRKQIKSLLTLERPNYRKLSQYSVAPGSLSHEYIADLGQALFHSNAPKPQSDDTVPNEPKDKSLAETVLVLQQPFLPHVLARSDFEPNEVPKKSIVDGPLDRMLVHLRLRPVTHVSHCPPIELFLTGQDASLGLRQPLEIKKVFAVLDEWQHVVLLPHHPLDIVMTRQSKVDLLYNKHIKTAPAYLNVLGQLGSYLEKAQSLDRVQLPPIWRLDVSPLLDRKRVAPSIKGGTASPNADSKADNSLDDDQTATENATTPSKLMCTYVLEPPEFLDVTSYTSTLAPDRSIEHITCDTDSVDRPRQRQILRITADPLSNLFSHDARRSSTKVKVKPNANATKTANVVEKHQWFRQSMSAAYELATLLHDAGTAAGKSQDR